MTLAELAFACFLYSLLTEYDESYLRLLEFTNGSPDLTQRLHRRAMLVWLNSWGCRQFAVQYHGLASGEIVSWYTEWAAALPPRDTHLWEVDEENVAWVGAAYASLRDRIASRRARAGESVAVSVGPTGAAKILFAIRPRAFPPWDAPIRRSLGLDGSEAAYVSFLRTVVATLDELRQSCENAGLRLTDLPVELGRPRSTVAKLIDEYYWVTRTKGWTVPDSDVFRRWACWSSR